MSTLMIRLADAQAAIRHAIEYYARDVRELRAKAAQRGPGEEPDEGEEALLIAARLAQEGAERARHALATVPVYEAVDLEGRRIVDKRGYPREAHADMEEYAIKDLLRTFGETARQASMVNIQQTADPFEERTDIRLRFTLVRPMAARWEAPQAYNPAHRGAVTAEQFEAIWNDDNGEEEQE